MAELTLGHTNPFGIVQAVSALFEGVVQAADPKRQKDNEERETVFSFLPSHFHVTWPRSSGVDGSFTLFFQMKPLR